MGDRAAALRDAAIAKPFLDAGDLDAQKNEVGINEERSKPPE